MIEDNPDDAELTKRAFRKAHVCNRLILAKDGVEALDYLMARGQWEGRGTETDPALILLDLKLPKIDGLDVLREMRSNPRTKVLPVIVLTSSIEEQDVIRSYDLGANSYIHKPVDMQQFVEAVRELGLYWLVLNSGVSANPAACCWVSERIRQISFYLKNRDSLQLAAGSFNVPPMAA